MNLPTSKCYDGASRSVRRILDRCLSGVPLDIDDALVLDSAQGDDLLALRETADAVRTEQVGDGVGYVVNRNVNFTNVCVKSCHFCAFARDLRSDDGYFLPVEEVVRLAVEARDLGASEVCVQAGLVPNGGGRQYIDILQGIKQAAPELHIHACSPEEVRYAASVARVPVREFLAELVEAGLDSLPGTAAEILDDELRERISPGRLTAGQWIDVVTTAHELGIPTTATMMFGHAETTEHRISHMALLRSMQRETGGFTEFVPLAFVHDGAPLYRDRARQLGVRPGPTDDERARTFAIARLMLGADFRNIQVSWVKEGAERTRAHLAGGANDLGGTLMNESVSVSAGAQHGQLMTPEMLRALARGAGRVPYERTTLYGVRRRFDEASDEEVTSALDAVLDPSQRFGTYETLVDGSRHRFAVSR